MTETERDELLIALAVIGSGWRTEDEGRRYEAARATIYRYARIAHLTAELERLDPKKTQ